MALRPAKTCRIINKMAWSRFSKKKPRKSYVKTMPHNALNIFEMGDVRGKFELRLDLVAEEPVQIRDNSIESARQAVNKHLEKHIPMGYRFSVLVYPHNVIRENKMILGAGADRLQKGMRKAFGKAVDIAARIRKGQTIFTVRAMRKDEPLVREAYRRAKVKMPGHFKLLLRETAG